MYTSQKRTTSQCQWHKRSSSTWNDIRTFQRSLLSYLIDVLNRNICGYQEQRSIGIETMRENWQFFFHFRDKSSVVNCNNIAVLLKSLGLEYDTSKWKLFIDLSSRSLKAVLHNCNSFTSMPIKHSVQMKAYKSMYHL